MATQHTLLTIRNLARRYAIDTDTANQFESDANYNVQINVHYRWVREFGGPRQYRVANIVSGAAGVSSMLTTATDYQRIVRLYWEDTNTGATIGAEMEFMERDAFEAMKSAYGDSPEAAPSVWTAYREWAAVASPGSSIGKWRILVSPPCVTTTTYFSGLVEKGITELSADGDVPDILPHEGDIIARLVAADMLVLMGRDDAKRQQVLSVLPADMKESLGLSKGTGERGASR